MKIKLLFKSVSHFFLSWGSSVAAIVISHISWSQLGTCQAVPSSPLFKRIRNKISTRCDELTQKEILTDLLSNNFSI